MVSGGSHAAVLDPQTRQQIVIGDNTGPRL